MISIAVLIFVFVLITLRKISGIKIDIWVAMLLGAILDIVLFQTSIKDAFNYIDWNVIIFLFCMFSVGAGLEISGYIESLNYRLIRNFKNIDGILIFFIFFSAFFSAFLMNDTIAIIGSAMLIRIAKDLKIPSKILVLALCFSVTIGSVLSPIGNPQNLLIAINSNMKNPFFSFISKLFIPTVINLFLIYWILKLFYPDEFKNIDKFEIKKPQIKSRYLYLLSHFTIALLFSLIIIKIYFSINHKEFSLTLIAVISSIPFLFFSFDKRVYKLIDYKTLLFFCSMFVVTKTAWNSGYIQKLIYSIPLKFDSIEFIFLSSIIISQFISNVPLVSLFLPVLSSLNAPEVLYISLAAASTIAGNLTILGAASNVIIIQNVEKRFGSSISSIEFLKIGFVFTLINTFIYYLFLKFF